MERGSGIIMHITSLPNKYGIGSFGEEAFKFIDFLKNAGQKYWQVLPLGPTGYGDSPYQCFSAFAGNPYFIGLDLLVKDGLLRLEDIENIDLGQEKERVDYYKIFKNKMEILKKAYKNNKESLEEFKLENKNWIEDYGLFMSLKNKFDLKAWYDWDKDIRFREKEAMDKYKKELEDEIGYWIFLQYVFHKQWSSLKEYANSNGIKIIGDIPIYVAGDSCDVWANHKMFLLDEERVPLRVAGCPPDYFSETGQLWGNPLYNWEYLDKNNYIWWINRIKTSLKLYDVVRIDHFRGFEAFWSIPYGDKTAINGEWVKGPGIKLFNKIKDELGEVNIIAEDLGLLTQEVIDFLKETGFPGMKVLQFAFSRDYESQYVPHNHIKNCVVYTGTHDNDTFLGWFQDEKNKGDVEYAKEYLKLSEEEGYNWGFIRGAWSSVAALAMAPLQDFLGLDNNYRMNRPSIAENNWTWRAGEEQLNEDLEHKIKKLTELYRR
ncbi:4-alpha-glucanotransferase [Clostridium intestinale]|uniref:4-alpha-glucanotransferase n=1 Tax=Clostridium intestinale DSM 6191 TaxID=1121320 RepID=A0A1M6A5M0_9CLOT|nr:4-alpha-glucanotransferase [Clostridium intestinale]SHI31774.1 4-alpha-glucanotransferase [Clostridium intestinale DSM 6191]